MFKKYPVVNVTSPAFFFMFNKRGD